MQRFSLLLGAALLVFPATSLALDQVPQEHGQQASGAYSHDQNGWSGPHAKAHKHHVCWRRSHHGKWEWVCRYSSRHPASLAA
jgi:hypothetical protein